MEILRFEGSKNQNIIVCLIKAGIDLFKSICYYTDNGKV